MYIYMYIYIYTYCLLPWVSKCALHGSHRHWNHRARWPLGSAYGLLHPLRKWCHRPPTNSPHRERSPRPDTRGHPGHRRVTHCFTKRVKQTRGSQGSVLGGIPTCQIYIYIYVYGTGFKHERHGLTNEHREFVLLFWVTVKMGYTLVYLIYCHLERELCDLPNVYPSW